MKNEGFCNTQGKYLVLYFFSIVKMMLVLFIEEEGIEGRISKEVKLK